MAIYYQSRPKNSQLKIKIYSSRYNLSFKNYLQMQFYISWIWFNQRNALIKIFIKFIDFHPLVKHINSNKFFCQYSL